MRAHSHTHFQDNLSRLINAHFRVQSWILSLWFHIKDFPSDLFGLLPSLKIPLKGVLYSQCPSILDSFQPGPFSHPSVLFPLNCPAVPQVLGTDFHLPPGTTTFTSEVILGTLPLCIPTLLPLLSFNYPGLNHFISFLTGSLASGLLTISTDLRICHFHGETNHPPTPAITRPRHFNTVQAFTVGVAAAFPTLFPLPSSLINCRSLNTPGLSMHLFLWPLLFRHPHLYLLKCPQPFNV